MNLKNYLQLNDAFDEDYINQDCFYCATFEYKTFLNKTNLKIVIYELKENKRLNIFDVIATKQLKAKPNKTTIYILNVPTEQLTSLTALTSFEINKTYKGTIERVKQYHKEHLKNTLLYYVVEHIRKTEPQAKAERIEQARKDLRASAPTFAFCLEQKRTATQTFIYKAIADQQITLDILELYERKAMNRFEINLILNTQIRGLRQNGFEYLPIYLDKVLEQTRTKWAHKMKMKELYFKLYAENIKGHTEQEARRLTLEQMNGKQKEQDTAKNQKTKKEKANKKKKAK